MSAKEKFIIKDADKLSEQDLYLLHYYTLPAIEREAILKWIKNNLNDTKTIAEEYYNNSYHLKHLCENGVGFYIKEEAFITAMIISGYSMITHIQGPHYFNISRTMKRS